MEEEKAAAYYDELTRKGEGAARFKQGLGFSSASNDAAPSRGSALSSSASYLSSFVKASSPSKASELQKEAELASIQNKLTKKRNPGEVQSQSQSSSRVSRERDRDDRRSIRRSRSRERHSRHRSRSRSRDNDRRPRRRSQSRDRDRHSRRRSRSHSRSRSRDDHRRRRGRRSISRERDRERVESRRRRSRSESPKRRRSEKSDSRNGSKVENERIHNVDYAKLIEGYDKMMPAERVKAKMKLQISETVKKDEANMGSGWERFDFDKDAPLDDEEIEAAEDDAVLVKHMGQSFRFSAVEARKEDDLKAAHDKAMFGAPLLPPSPEKDEEDIKSTKDETTESAPVTNLISDQVLTRQQGSWRDRIRKT